MREGYRLLSAYRDRNDIKFWIITEADRSVTTVLLPEDYYRQPPRPSGRGFFIAVVVDVAITSP